MANKPKLKYSLKKVRATEPGWDGFLLRDDGDEFITRVYDGVEPAKWYEIIGDANANEGAVLEALNADPMKAVPETQRPPDEKAIKKAQQPKAPSAVPAYDGSVL